MKLKIEFGFGIEYRGDGTGILGHEQADGIAKICLRAADLFGGYTLFNTLGAWKDPDTNQLVTEEGCTVSVLVDNKYSLELHEDINRMVEEIKGGILQQKAVAVTRTEVQFDIL